MSSCQPSTTEVSRLLISELERRNRRERTTRTLRSTYTCFASTFGNQPLDSITEPQLSDWLDSHGWQPRTQRNHLAAISQLYRYAIRHAWATANVASSMLPPVIECAEPRVFTPVECARLLGASEDFGFLPFVAIGLFAGLRSAEIERLDWQDVKADMIVVRAAGAKTRSRRAVDILPPLDSWLVICRKVIGPVVESGWRRWEQFQNASGVAWKANGLRHSFCSYHLAQFKDPVRTAYLAGNSPRMIDRHYRALVTTEEARHFWSIKPMDRQNVLPLFPITEARA